MIIDIRGEPMSDDELRSVVNARLQVTTANLASTVSTDRAKALNYYRGNLLGNEVAGRSAVVSRDVQETVDGILPSLLKVFASGPPVEFKAKRPEYEDGAKQATDLVNWLWNDQNPGFLNYNTWFKDALLQRIGCIKIWWDETEKRRVEYYRGLTQGELEMLDQDEGTEIVIQKRYADPTGSGMELFDIEAVVMDPDGRISIDCIPPEEFLFDYYAKNTENARVLGHRVEYSVSDLREMGHDDDLIETIPSGDYLNYTPDRLARFNDKNGLFWQSETDPDPASRRVWVSECYMNIDYDGDGIAEMRRILVAGPNANVILENEECDSHPFAVLTPRLIPHRIEGLSRAAQTIDIQDIKTTLLRQSLDATYLATNPQVIVIPDQVNIDDFLISGPGKIKRVRSLDAVREMVTPDVTNGALKMMEHMDQIRELRTGLPRVGGELDSNVLNNSATGANIVNNVRLERVELIARTFAETGVKQAFKRILELTQKYQNKSQVIRLNGKFVEVDPSEWRDGFDMEIRVGLGTGSKEQTLMHLMPIKQTQEQVLLNLGPDNPLCGMQEYYNTCAAIVKNAGLGDVSQYFKNPAESPPQQPHPPPPNPDMIKAQTEREKIQAQMAANQQTQQHAMQMDQIKAEHQMQLEQAKAEHDMQLQFARMQADIQINREKAAAQVQADANKELMDYRPETTVAAAGNDGIGPEVGRAPPPMPMGDPNNGMGSVPMPSIPDLPPMEAMPPAQPAPLPSMGPLPQEAAQMPPQQIPAQGVPPALPGQVPSLPASPPSQVAATAPPPTDPGMTQFLAINTEEIKQQRELLIAAMKEIAAANGMIAAGLKKLTGPVTLVRDAKGRAVGRKFAEDDE